MQQTQPIHEFREYSVCPKCNWNHLPPSPPTSKFDKKQNALVRTCLNCGYEWLEKPADDAPPPLPPPKKQGSMWKKIEPKKP